MTNKILLSVVLFVLSISFVVAEDIHGIVTRVHDGDTYVMQSDDGSEIKVRQQAIDAPELTQSFGSQSAEFNTMILMGREVILHKSKIDLYGRTLGRTSVKICDKYYDAELIMISHGYAWHYKQYDKNKDLDAVEQMAREQKLGLWSQDNPTPPWTFRRDKRNNKN